MPPHDRIEESQLSGKASVSYTGAQTIADVPPHQLASFDGMLMRRATIGVTELDAMPRSVPF